MFSWWNPDCSRALHLKIARWKSYRRKRFTATAYYFCFLFFSFLRSQCKLPSHSSIHQKHELDFMSHPLIRTSVYSLYGLVFGGYQVNEYTLLLPVISSRWGSSGFLPCCELFRHLPQQNSMDSRKPLNLFLSPFSYPIMTVITINFSIQELTTSISTCKNTSAGPYGIHYRMLCHLPRLYHCQSWTAFQDCVSS